MGNVGIARDGTIGNSYYNPAGLGFSKINKLVGSGTLLQVSTQESKESNLRAKASQTQALPIAAGTSWAKEDWAWAFSVFNVNNDSVNLTVDYDVANIGSISGRAKFERFGILVGPSFGKKISATTAIGASAFYYQQDSGSIISIPFQRTVGANTVIGSSYADTRSTSRSIKLVAGGLSKFEYFDIGVRLETAPLLAQATYESSGHTISYTKDAGNNIVSETTNIQEATKSSAKFDAPHLLGFGIGTLLGPRTRLFSDVNMSTKVKFKPIATASEQEFDGGLRLGLGVEHFAQGQRWLGGMTYIQDDSGDDTFLYISGGHVSIDRRSDTALGFFYLTTIKAVETQQSAIGLLFSSTIKL